MLCLHILQSSLGLINTLMIQDTLALPEWADVLTDADRRGLTPVFHTTMTLDGFTAGTGKAVDWMFVEGEPGPAAEEVIARTGAILSGR